MKCPVCGRGLSQKYVGRPHLRRVRRTGPRGFKSRAATRLLLRRLVCPFGQPKEATS